MSSSALAGRGSVAGSSGDGGVEFRRAVASFAVVAGLSGAPLRGLSIPAADAYVSAVVLETEEAVDDLRVDFASGWTAFVQAKRTLKGGGVLAKAVAQWVRASEGALDPARHRLVIAAGELSDSMKALGRALDAQRLSVPGTPLGRRLSSFAASRRCCRRLIPRPGTSCFGVRSSGISTLRRRTGRTRRTLCTSCVDW